MNIVLNLFISSIICFVMYLSTAIIMWYTDGLKLHDEPVGALALMLYFLVPFGLIHLLKIAQDMADEPREL